MIEDDVDDDDDKGDLNSHKHRLSTKEHRVFTISHMARKDIYLETLPIQQKGESPQTWTENV